MTTAALGDDRTIATHLQHADPALLLASLVTITGATDRIDEFAPALSHTYGPAGLVSAMEPEPLASLHAWALEVLADDHGSWRGSPALRGEAFRALAGALVGQEQPSDSIPFLQEQAGFVSFVETVPRTQPVPDGFRLAVIGAGMAGVAMAVAAAKAGIDCVVLEKQHAIGGVWNANTYPGAAVDTPSTYYSFSFEVNPEWTHSFPAGPQYRTYLERVADTYGVRDRFQFSAEVTGLRWDDATATWHVSYVQDGRPQEVVANVVVTAAGYLTNPKLPDVPGLEGFAGEWFHTGRWDHDVDLRGKRVAVVGAGCTSVQVVDSIADDVASLTLFQRQAHWIMPPSGMEPLHDSVRWLLRRVPSYDHWQRLHTFLTIGDVNYPAVRYDADWAAEHPLSISPANDMVLQVGQAYLQEAFADRPDLQATMTPDFAPHGKRIVRDPGGYFAALKRPTSTVVDSGLAEVTPSGIVDGDGVLHELDVIIYATGFTLEYLSGWEIRGKDEMLLSEVWKDAPTAYNGCLVPGFPNLFITSGPHASAAHGGGHNFTVEAVVHYVVESLQTLFETGASRIEVTQDAHAAWVEEVDAELADSIWVRERRAHTYYRNAAGDVTLASPFTMEDFWNRLRRPDLDALTLS